MITVDCPWCDGPMALEAESRRRRLRRLLGAGRAGAGSPADGDRSRPLEGRRHRGRRDDETVAGMPAMVATALRTGAERASARAVQAAATMPAMDLARGSDALIRAGRRLGARGLIAAGEGNLSVRLDADRLLRHADRSSEGRARAVRPRRRLARPSRARGACRRPGWRPTSDLAIHLAVHAARPDIGAVVHAHLPASMALTLAGERPDPTALPETAFHLPRLPLVRVRGDGQPRSSPTRIAAALTEGPEPFADAAILERHGAEAVGPRSGRGRRPAGARRGAVPGLAGLAADSRRTGSGWVSV